MNGFALAELFLVFAAVVGWAVYEIVSLRRYRRRTEAEARARAEAARDGERPPIGDA